MVNIQTLKPGQRIGIRLAGEHKMNKRDNPLLGRVTRDHLFSATVAGTETYCRVMQKADPSWTPSGKPCWWTWTEVPGVAAHKETGKRYVGCVSVHPVQTAYLVDGRPATADELATIAQFTPDREKPDFMLFGVENIENAVE